MVEFLVFLFAMMLVGVYLFIEGAKRRQEARAADELRATLARRREQRGNAPAAAVREEQEYSAQQETRRDQPAPMRQAPPIVVVDPQAGRILPRYVPMDEEKTPKRPRRKGSPPLPPPLPQVQEAEPAPAAALPAVVLPLPATVSRPIGAVPQQVVSMLRDRKNFAAAILLQEILDKPRCMRPWQQR